MSKAQTQAQTPKDLLNIRYLVDQQPLVHLVHLKDKEAEIDIYHIHSYTLIDVAIETTIPGTMIPEYFYERAIYCASPKIIAETVETLFARSKFKLIKFLEALERYAEFVIGEVSYDGRRCLLVPESVADWYRLMRISKLRGYLCYRPEAAAHIKWLYERGMLPFHWEEYVPIILSRARKILNLDP